VDLMIGKLPLTLAALLLAILFFGSCEITKPKAQCAIPIFSPNSGSFTSGQYVTITCSTNNATIRYTKDGSEPTSSALVYTSPLYITSEVTIKAKAYKSGMNPSKTSIAVITVNIPISPNFVLVPGGTYSFGASSITVSTFYIDKYEVTQLEYYNVMEIEPTLGFGTGDSYPAYFMSWYNAIEYCNRRSTGENLTPCYAYGTYGTNIDAWPTGWNSDANNHTNISCNWEAEGYRLPTEAEWLWAAKGGQTTPIFAYCGSNDVTQVAWYIDNSDGTSHAVGTKLPNALGIYDMSGNVWEWNWDIYGIIPSISEPNPHGASTGTYRVSHGGAWQAYDSSCTIAYRSYGLPTFSTEFVGFRVCRNK
jgi:formylglycine-generating enzyme